MTSQNKNTNKMTNFNELMKLTTSMNMDLQKIIFNKVEENMNENKKQIDNVSSLKEFMGKCEDIDDFTYDYEFGESEFCEMWSSKKGDKWLDLGDYDKKHNRISFGKVVCYDCGGNIYDRMDNYYCCSFRGKFFCDYDNCKNDYVERKLNQAEEEIEKLKNEYEKKMKDNTEELLLKYDNGNHFKIFAHKLLPQFIREFNKEGSENDTKRLNNLYKYFKNINLAYGLRPYPNNKNKYYRKYHKGASIENVEVKIIPDK